MSDVIKGRGCRIEDTAGFHHGSHLVPNVYALRPTSGEIFLKKAANNRGENDGIRQENKIDKKQTYAQSVDSENGRVRRIDQPRVLPLLRQPAGNVLPDSHHADDVALLVPPRRGVEQHLETHACLGHEWELEVRGLLAVQGLVEHGLDGRLELVGDELLDEVLDRKKEKRGIGRDGMDGLVITSSAFDDEHTGTIMPLPFPLLPPRSIPPAGWRTDSKYSRRCNII